MKPFSHPVTRIITEGNQRTDFEGAFRKIHAAWPRCGKVLLFASLSWLWKGDRTHNHDRTRTIPLPCRATLTAKYYKCVQIFCIFCITARTKRKEVLHCTGAMQSSLIYTVRDVDLTFCKVDTCWFQGPMSPVCFGPLGITFHVALEQFDWRFEQPPCCKCVLIYAYVCLCGL